MKKTGTSSIKDSKSSSTVDGVENAETKLKHGFCSGLYEVAMAQEDRED